MRDVAINPCNTHNLSYPRSFSCSFGFRCTHTLSPSFVVLTLSCFSICPFRFCFVARTLLSFVACVLPLRCLERSLCKDIFLTCPSVGFKLVYVIYSIGAFDL